MERILSPHFLKCLHGPGSQLPLKCKHIPLGSKSLWSSYYLFHHKLPSKSCILAQVRNFSKIFSESPTVQKQKYFLNSPTRRLWDRVFDEFL